MQKIDELRAAHRLAMETAFKADNAWTKAYRAVCPKGTWPGDFRYTDAAKAGELAPLHDAFIAAQHAYHEAWQAVMDAEREERARAA